MIKHDQPIPVSSEFHCFQATKAFARQDVALGQNEKNEWFLLWLRYSCLKTDAHIGIRLVPQRFHLTVGDVWNLKLDGWPALHKILSCRLSLGDLESDLCWSQGWPCLSFRWVGCNPWTMQWNSSHESILHVGGILNNNWKKIRCYYPLSG